VTRLILVRHGQAVCNVERTIEGVTTCRGLSPLGLLQVAAVAHRLASEGLAVDFAYCSPIRRAAQTADALGTALGVAFEHDASLEEVRPGDAEGLSWDQYTAFYGNSEGWNATVPFAPNAEAWTDFAARVAQGLDRISDLHRNKTILIVTHGGVIDASLFHYFALNPTVQSPIDFESSNTGITEWERRTFTNLDDSEVHRWRLARYNDASHLHRIANPEN
jgi:2,3-bisphosphoglycerate-dependent phosphoglycerate mutase